MDEQKQPLIEIDDDDDLTLIANQVANGQAGSEEGEGDLPGGWDLNGDDDRSEVDPRTYVPRKTPVHGQVAYANVPLGSDFQFIFAAADEQRIRVEREKQGDPETPSAYEQIPDPVRMAMYIQGMMGRDIQADERRPADQKVYWPGGLFKGASYKTLIVDTHMRDFDKTLKKQLEAQRRVQFRQARKMLGPEWSDETILHMLGADTTDEE